MTATTSTATASEPRRRAPTSLPLRLAWLGLVTLGFNVVRVGGWAASDIIFFLLAAVIFAKLLTGDDRGLSPIESRRGSQLVIVGTLLMLTAGVVSSFVAYDVGGSLSVVLRLGYLSLLWFWMLRAVSTDRRALQVLMDGWRVGLIVTSLIGVLDHVGLLNVATENSEGRQTALWNHYNDFGAYLAVGLPLVMLSPRRPGESPRRHTLRRASSVGLVSYALTTSGSITALFAAAVGIGATGVAAIVLTRRSRPRRRHPLAPLFTMVVVLASGYLLATADLPVFERIERYSSGDKYLVGSMEKREDLNQLAINDLDNRLLVGIGLDGASSLGKLGFSNLPGGGIHNMYLKTMVETGLFGLVGLLMILYASLRAGVLLSRTLPSSDPLSPVVVSCFGALIGAMTFALSGPIMFQRYFWLPMAMIGCTWAVRRQELRGVAAESRTASPATVTT